MRLVASQQDIEGKGKRRGPKRSVNAGDEVKNWPFAFEIRFSAIIEVRAERPFGEVVSRQLNHAQASSKK